MKVLFLLLAFSALSASASTFKCGEASWKSGPVMEAGKFKGELIGECTVNLDQSPEFRQLESYFETEINRTIVTTYSQGVADSELLTGGRTWDLLIKVKEGKIRNKFQLASDGRDQLIYQTRSKDIQFGGFAGYLKKLDVRVEVRRVSDRKVTLRLSSLTWVDKPLIAPPKIFFDKAVENSLKQFPEELEKLAVQVRDNL